MFHQQVERIGQIFPSSLEWLGGRTTIQGSAFSARNAHICMKDMMEEDEQRASIMLEICAGKLLFRSGTTVHSEFDLSAIQQIHIFSTDPEYAVLEICEANAPARMEVLRAQNREVLQQICNFILQKEIKYPAAPTAPWEEDAAKSREAETQPSFVDSYAAPDTDHPVSNGASTPEFQMEEGYEEMARQIIEDSLNMPEILQSQEHNEPRSRSTTSASSDSDGHTPISIDHTEARQELSVPPIGKPEPKKNEIPAKKDRSFGKVRLLEDLIAEDRICKKKHADDERVFLLTKKAPSKPKVTALHSNIMIMHEWPYPKKYVSKLYFE